MNYQEFLTTIRTQLSLRIETGVTLDIRSFTKNNGTHYDGLVLLHPKKNVSPAIYLMPYYHRYLEGVCLEEICEDILHTYQAHAPEENFDTSYFTDFSRASEHIVMRLVSFEKNQELLKEVPFFRYQDLAVIFYCLLHALLLSDAMPLLRSAKLMKDVLVLLYPQLSESLRAVSGLFSDGSALWSLHGVICGKRYLPLLHRRSIIRWDLPVVSGP